MGPTFQKKLQRYADLTVKVGIGLQPGQRLIIYDAPVESAPLVRLIVKSAYKVGARLVDVLWSNDALTLTRFQYAPRDSFSEFPTWRTDALLKAAKQGDAFLYSYGSDPDLLREQDPKLVRRVQHLSESHRLPHAKEVMTNESNWSVIAMPIDTWAARVFPNETPGEQLQKLWDAIFKVCRLDQHDPFAAWQSHAKQLAAKRDYLNAKQYVALTYTAPGTDLTLGLPRNHRWIAGQKQTKWGTPYIPNLPTEEVYTMPHKDRVNGVVTSTKPLSYGGVLLENISLTFSRGRIVSSLAEKGQAILKDLIETSQSTACLGEVALVAHSSPVSQTGLLFYNILLDENASSHLALGQAYRDCVANGPAMSDEEFAAAGGNESIIHLDFMIGSDQMDVDGITQDGMTEPIIRAGEWTF